MADDSGGYAIPTEMRVLGERGLEQAKIVCASFLAAAERALNRADSRVTAARSGAKEVGHLAWRFVEHHVAASFAFAEKLARARDAREIIDLHADYAGSQIAALSEQAKALSRQVAELANQAVH
ncbi:MAG: phasin family protein [Pseudolabrys sp.]|nr:phasin family protein [Pseudolabrys sp.]